MEAECWSIPVLWRDRTAVILGGGPSLTRPLVDSCIGLPVVAVNNSFRLAPWADFLFWGDRHWYFPYREELESWKGRMVTFSDNFYHGDDPILFVKRGQSPGLATDRATCNWNRNSGAAAVNLAYHLGASRIVLLGFDMRIIDGKANWHDDHLKNNCRVASDEIFRGYSRSFRQLALDLTHRGITVINGTPGSALPDFPIQRAEPLIAAAHLEAERVGSNAP